MQLRHRLLSGDQGQAGGGQADAGGGPDSPGRPGRGNGSGPVRRAGAGRHCGVHRRQPDLCRRRAAQRHHAGQRGADYRRGRRHYEKAGGSAPFRQLCGGGHRPGPADPGGGGRLCRPAGGGGQGQSPGGQIGDDAVAGPADSGGGLRSDSRRRPAVLAGVQGAADGLPGQRGEHRGGAGGHDPRGAVPADQHCRGGLHPEADPAAGAGAGHELHRDTGPGGRAVRGQNRHHHRAENGSGKRGAPDGAAAGVLRAGTGQLLRRAGAGKRHGPGHERDVRPTGVALDLHRPDSLHVGIQVERRGV